MYVDYGCSTERFASLAGITAVRSTSSNSVMPIEKSADESSVNY
jgi:hypothetical protein